MKRGNLDTEVNTEGKIRRQPSTSHSERPGTCFPQIAWKEPTLPKPLLLAFLLSSTKTVDQGFTSLRYILAITPGKLLQKSICGDIYTFIPDISHLCLLSLFSYQSLSILSFQTTIGWFSLLTLCFHSLFSDFKTGFYFLSSACFEFILLFFSLHSQIYSNLKILLPIFCLLEFILPFFSCILKFIHINLKIFLLVMYAFSAKSLTLVLLSCFPQILIYFNFIFIQFNDFFLNFPSDFSFNL